MVDESAWSAIMTLLAQARIEANDTASVPPLVMVKREQVIDILAHLEPFGEALQVREKSKGKPPILWMKRFNVILRTCMILKSYIASFLLS